MPKKYDYVKMDKGYFLYLNLRHPADVIRMWGLWEPDVTKFLNQYLKTGMTFVDVGAHRGTYTMLAAFLVQKEGSVYAFEPFANHVSCLEKARTKNSFSNVHIINGAVGEIKGKVRITSDAPHIDEHGELEVDLVPIDSVVEKADLVKIDTDDNELQVIYGIEKLVKTGCAILIEYSTFAYQDRDNLYKDITEFLQKYGYSASALDYNGTRVPIEKVGVKNGDIHVLYEKTL